MSKFERLVLKSLILILKFARYSYKKKWLESPMPVIDKDASDHIKLIAEELDK